MVKNKDKWSALSLKDRADFYKIAVENGYTDRNEIIKLYNSFDKGGKIDLGNPNIDKSVNFDSGAYRRSGEYQQKLNTYKEYYRPFMDKLRGGEYNDLYEKWVNDQDATDPLDYIQYTDLESDFYNFQNTLRNDNNYNELVHNIYTPSENYKPNYTNESTQEALTDVNNGFNYVEDIYNTKRAQRAINRANRYAKRHGAKNDVLDFNTTERITLNPNSIERSNYNPFGKNINVGYYDEHEGLNHFNTVAHEAAHSRNLYNNTTFSTFEDSPYYGNDYSYIKNRHKRWLKPNNPKTPHDAELSEAYSDLMGLRADLYSNGIVDGTQRRYRNKDIKNFLKTEEGKNNRYLQYHDNINQTRKALNRVYSTGGPIERGDYIEFDTEGDARYFAERYKKHYNSFGDGGNTDSSKGYVTTQKEDLKDLETFNSNWYKYRDKQLSSVIDSYNRQYYTKDLKWYQRLFPNEKTEAIGARNYINDKLNNVKEFTMSEALKDINTRKWLQDYYYQILPEERPDTNLIGPPKPVSDYDLGFLAYINAGMANKRLNTIVYADDSNNDSTKIHERAHISIPFIKGWSRHPVLSPISNVKLQNTTEPDSYFDSISEIYARLMQLRYDNNLDPSHTYTKEEINAMRNDPYFKDHHIFDRYTDESILMLLNEVAQNTINTNRLDYVNPDNIVANGGKINKFAPGGPLNEGIEEYNNVVHENNPLLEEQSYYDDTEIFPTLDLRDFNRRDVKSLAFTVAGRNNDHYGVTVDEVLNDKLNYNSKYSRQEERFKRLVGRQYKRNKRYTEQMERLKSAGQGNVQAMQDYITKGTERVAPLGIPLVAGPAALATANAGAFSLAADTTGKLLSKNAVRWPLEVLGFGDFIYNNVFTDEGVKKTVKRAKEGDFWGALGSGVVDLLDFAGVGATGYDAAKLLDPTFSTLRKAKGSLNTFYDTITAKKRRDKALKLRRQAYDERDKVSRNKSDFLNQNLYGQNLQMPTLEATYTMQDDVVGARQSTIKTTPFTLPDGTTIQIETKTGVTGNTTKTYPVMTDPNYTFFRRVAGMNPYDLKVRYTGPGGKVSTSGLSDVPLQASNNPAFSEYVKQAQDAMGNTGIVGGSSVLYEKGYISGVPNDLELITTKSRRDELIKRIGFDTNSAKQKPLALSSTSKVSGGNKDTDIQIIDEDKDGYAVGKLAHELYRVLHPEEHAKYLSTQTLKNFNNPNATSASLRLPKPNGGYYTANELLDEFNSSGAIVKKTLVDALSVGKMGMGYDGTKLMRPIGILSNTDPVLQAEILDSIHTIGKFNLGEDYKTVKQLYPNMDYSNIRRNEEFLEELGFDKSLASNPQAMENITEYYHLQLSGSNRVFHSPKSQQDIIKFAHPTKDWGGGSASGAGGNSVIGTGQAFQYPYHSMSQFPLFKDGTNVKTPLDIMDAYHMSQHDALLVDIAEPSQIQKLEALGIKVQPGSTLGDIDNQLASFNSEQITEEVGDILGINGVFGREYGEGIDYFGRYSKKPVAASYRIVNTQNGPQVNYEMGRLLHKYKDMSMRNAMTPQEAITFKDSIMSTLDDFLSGKITEKEGFRFKKGDYDKLVDIKKEVEKMDDRMSALDRRIDNLDQIQGKLWDLADRVDDVITKSVVYSVPSAMGLGVVGIANSYIKNKKEWELTEKYEEDFKQTDEYKDDYYTKLMDLIATPDYNYSDFPSEHHRDAWNERRKKEINYAKQREKNKYLTGGGIINSYINPSTVGGAVAKGVVQLFDPTGISSYPDVYAAGKEFFQDPTLANAGRLAFETIGALPLIGRVTAPFKAAKTAKLANKVGDAYKLSKLANNAESVNKVIDTLPELIPLTRKAAEATQNFTTKYVVDPLFNLWASKNKYSRVAEWKVLNDAIKIINAANNTADVLSTGENIVNLSK